MEKKLKNLKCPKCNGKAEMILKEKKVIVVCKARKTCGYINQRDYDKIQM